MLPDDDKRYAIETYRSSEKSVLKKWFKINYIQLLHLLVVWWLTSHPVTKFGTHVVEASLYLLTSYYKDILVNILSICGNKMPTRCNRLFLLQILLLAQHEQPANRTHNPQLHTIPTTWKPKHQIPQAATTCIILSRSWWWA